MLWSMDLEVVILYKLSLIVEPDLKSIINNKIKQLILD